MSHLGQPDRCTTNAQGRLLGKNGVCLGLAMLLSSCSGDIDLPADTAAPPDAEVRTYDISVDGKPAGHYRMDITARKNGRLVMSGHAHVRVTRLVYTYRYDYEGEEEYEAGRLWRVNSKTTDAGEHFTVEARPTKDGLCIQVNGVKRSSRADVWTTSFWHLLPGPGDRKVTLLEPDTGKETQGRLHFLANQTLTVAGRKQTCGHYRVQGMPSDVDLWYDEARRLVRQEYVDDGHPTVLQLKKIVHGQPDSPSR